MIDTDWIYIGILVVLSVWTLWRTRANSVMAEKQRWDNQRAHLNELAREVGKR